MTATLTLFRIRGIPVQVHASWLAIYGLIAWSLAVGYFPQVLPDVSAWAHWTNALLAALLLFVSVFVHELSHALVALRYGIPVRSITLHVFGGVSQLEREPERPGEELMVAIVGPLTSLAIAGVVLLTATVLDPGPAAAATMQYLVLVNVVVGLFNLVPGFPMDGGRVLRAALWKAKGDLRWATQVASSAGAAFGLLLIVLGVWRGLTGQFLGGLWFVVIGLFLRQAAAASYQHLVLRRSLAPRTVADAMTSPAVHVSPEVSVDALVEDFFWRHHVTSFPVVDGGRPLGLVRVHDLQRVPRERWTVTPVRELMLPLSAALTIAPGASLWEAFEKLSSNGVGRLAVLDDGQLVGYLSIKDVMHVLTLTTGAPGPQSVSRAA